jgi:hypothetical protein
MRAVFFRHGAALHISIPARGRLRAGEEDGWRP